MQVIIEVFCWTREPMEVRRLAGRKEAILTEMLGDMQPMLVSDVPAFMDGLAHNKVPYLLYSPPRVCFLWSFKRHHSTPNSDSGASSS